MKCYTIYYKLPNDSTNYVGSGYGTNEKEAVENFLLWCTCEKPIITGVEFYKLVRR